MRKKRRKARLAKRINRSTSSSQENVDPMAGYRAAKLEKKKKKKLKTREDSKVATASVKKRRTASPNKRCRGKGKKSKKDRYNFSNSFYEVVKDLKPFHLIDYNVNEPLFSFIAPAIRDYMYADYYKNVFHNDIPFEVIFVGNKPPKQEMPGNFKYIETDENPGKCYEIAARHATGEYLITSTDDLRYVNRFMVHLLHYCNTVDMDQHFIFYGKKRPPELAHSANEMVIKRSIWHKMGGLEKRSYQMGGCDWAGLIDLEFRLQRDGYKVFFAKNCISNEIERNWKYIGDTGVLSATWAVCESVESHLINDFNFGFWNPNNTIRMLPFIPYDDKDLRIKDNLGEKE